MASSCYVCGEPAESDCLVCGKAFCRSHGDRLCAQCSEQDEIERRAEAYEGLPSPLFFRGALAIAILAVLLEIGWDAYRTVSGSPTQIYVPPTAISIAQNATPQATAQPTVQATAQPAPQATPVAAKPTAAPPTPASAQKYSVQSGDSLWTIAAKFGVTVESIQTANNMGISDSLSIGQVLTIPAKQ